MASSAPASASPFVAFRQFRRLGTSDFQGFALNFRRVVRSSAVCDGHSVVLSLPLFLISSLVAGVRSGGVRRGSSFRSPPPSRLLRRSKLCSAVAWPRFSVFSGYAASLLLPGRSALSRPAFPVVLVAFRFDFSLEDG